MANSNQPEKDPRPGNLIRLGCIGSTLLALCIPIAITIGLKEPLLAIVLPLAVVAGFTIGLLVIWFTPLRKADTRELEAIKGQLAGLDQRLSNLEMIDSYERRRAERTPHGQGAPPSHGETLGNPAMAPDGRVMGSQEE